MRSLAPPPSPRVASARLASSSSSRRAPPPPPRAAAAAANATHAAGVVGETAISPDASVARSVTCGSAKRVRRVLRL